MWKIFTTYETNIFQQYLKCIYILNYPAIKVALLKRYEWREKSRGICISTYSFLVLKWTKTEITVQTMLNVTPLTREIMPIHTITNMGGRVMVASHITNRPLILS